MRKYAITLKSDICPINVVEAYGDEASYDNNDGRLDWVVYLEDVVVLAIPREHIAYVMSYPDTRPEVK